MVGGVGQRMLTSVSKRMAGEFFGNVAAAIAHRRRPPAAVEPVETARRPARLPPAVFTAPAKQAGVSSQDDFLKGIAVGAGLVVLGVVVGGLFGRRRR